MDQGFLKNLPYLPTDIIINILSRLPIRTIISCKCVCKPWLELVETPEFAKFHHSESVPGLIVYEDEMGSDIFKIFEFEDELELERHELHYVPVTKFQRRAFVSSPDRACIVLAGSANGLLFLCDEHTRPHSLYICNPITREYINLPNPEGILYYHGLVSYGFGVSQKTGQYKIVYRIQKFGPDPHRILKFDCHVYTLGTGSWRSVLPDFSHIYDCRSNGVFLNGNLHWLVSDFEQSSLISCFDLETELFKVFSPPLESTSFLRDVGVLGDHLCLCDYTLGDEVVMWIMKEYGVEKSWTKLYVMSNLNGPRGVVVYPIKVFRDGDVLMLWEENNFSLVFYSEKTRTTLNVDIFEQRNASIEAILHVSSFLSLKRFAMENVAKFNM